jgi:hypothetical protein
MEKIMSKTNHTSSFTALENHGAIEDATLDAMIGAFYAVEHCGGGKGGRSGSWFEALATALGQAMDAQARRL